VIVLSIVAYGWRAAVTKLKRAAKPWSSFKKVVALILIAVGISIVLWRHKTLESWMIERGLFVDTTWWEIEQIENIESE
jgi:hypothetical protein